jgi:hypothetical protein
MDDGSYSCAAPPSAVGAFGDTVTYTISDNDGDTQSSNLTISVATANKVVDGSGGSTLTGSDTLPDLIRRRLTARRRHPLIHGCAHGIVGA